MKLNEKKIAFISCVNNDLYYNESLEYIKNLTIPDGYEIEVIKITNADYMTKSYNQAMHKSDAKYKIYMHQDVFIVNKNFISDVLEIFENKKIGLIGMVGCVNIPSKANWFDNGLWTDGTVYICDGNQACEWKYSDFQKPYKSVSAVDAMLMATQYDVEWREDIFTGWDLYDISQSIEFKKSGYQVVVPYQEQPWVMHDHGILNYENYNHWLDVYINEYQNYIYSSKDINDIITIDTSLVTSPMAGSNLYDSRRNIVKSYPDSVDATISVVSYNRYDTTVTCVESILKNTLGIMYKLILVCNGCTDNGKTLEYFKSVKHENKLIINITNNLRAPFAYSQIMKYIEGKYYVHVPDDLILTHNWLSNLIKCAESNSEIGMVTPVSSNVSNFQCVNLSFNNYEELQAAASNYNTSTPKKWHERLRLITLGTLFTRECLEAIGNIFDTGFFHDFGDDDVSFRVRRAGYKCILARDTWVHHNHEFNDREPEKFNKSIDAGRKNFFDKYYGIDAWDDVNNFVFPYINDFIEPPAEKSNVKILGVDVKCGTPILDIKNKIREYGIYEATTSVFSQESKYHIDLETICNDKVICDRIEYFYSSMASERFDFIIFGESINSYANFTDILKHAYSLLNSKGQLFFRLKNTQHIFSLFNMIGSQVKFEDNVFSCTVDNLVERFNNNKIKFSLINKENYQIQPEGIKTLKQLLSAISDKEENYLIEKLITNYYWFKITKDK